MERIYLTRRNLLTLLAKLDNRKTSGEGECWLRKMDMSHPEYPCSIRAEIVAVEDEDYYRDRAAGPVREFPDGSVTMCGKA